MLIELPKFILKKNSKMLGHVHVAAHCGLFRESKSVENHSKTTSLAYKCETNKKGKNRKTIFCRQLSRKQFKRLDRFVNAESNRFLLENELSFI